MIKHKAELLQQIAAGVNRNLNARIANLKVILEDSNESFEFGLPEALDVLANDLYWDERGDWSEARIAKVETF